jgi:hypothetical protein
VHIKRSLWKASTGLSSFDLLNYAWCTRGRYYRRSDTQRIGEAFNLGSLPPDFIFSDWNDNFAPNNFQPVIRNACETGEREWS